MQKLAGASVSFPPSLLSFTLPPPLLPNPMAVQSPQHTSTWQSGDPTIYGAASPRRKPPPPHGMPPPPPSLPQATPLVSANSHTSSA